MGKPMVMVAMEERGDEAVMERLGKAPRPEMLGSLVRGYVQLV